MRRTLGRGYNNARDAVTARCRVFVGLTLAAGCVAAAQAHETTLSSSRLWVESTIARVVLELNAVDVDLAAGPLLGRYLGAHVRLGFVDGPACRQTIESTRAQGDHIVVELRFE